jgi:hypothetical protein
MLKHNGSTWVLGGWINMPTGNNGARFGQYGMDFFDNDSKIIIDATFFQATGDTNYAGRAWTFTLIGDTATLDKTIFHPDYNDTVGYSWGNFGYSARVSKNLDAVLVSAKGAYSLTKDAGAVYFIPYSSL